MSSRDCAEESVVSQRILLMTNVWGHKCFEDSLGYFITKMTLN